MVFNLVLLNEVITNQHAYTHAYTHLLLAISNNYQTNPEIAQKLLYMQFVQHQKQV